MIEKTGNKRKRLGKPTKGQAGLIFIAIWQVFVISFPLFLQSNPNLVSGNMTLQSIAEVTKMPYWYVVVILLPLIVTGFIWFWRQEGKRDKIEELIEQVAKQGTRIDMLIQRLDTLIKTISNQDKKKKK